MLKHKQIQNFLTLFLLLWLLSGYSVPDTDEPMGFWNQQFEKLINFHQESAKGKYSYDQMKRHWY